MRQIVLTFLCGVVRMRAVAWICCGRVFLGGHTLELGSGVPISKLAWGLFPPRPRLLLNWLAKSSNLDDLANQLKCLRNRGLVIGWPTLPGGAQRAFLFSRLLAGG